VNSWLGFQALMSAGCRANRASYGSTVVLRDIDRSSDVTYRLVSEEEADYEQGLISTSSPIGQSLLNKQEGDEIKVRTPSGVRNFEVISLTTIHGITNS
jgi:transcription elongation factor GreA